MSPAPHSASGGSTLFSSKGGPFLSGAALRERLKEQSPPGLLLLDARAERQYREGHLPGAVNLSARELNPVADGVRRLADRSELRRRLPDLEPSTELVLYGARGGADAAHAWWTLQALGLEDVAILDGGIEAWVAQGGELEREAGPGPSREPSPTATAQPHTAQPQDTPRDLVSLEELRNRLDDPDLAIVDTREPEEFSGEMKAAARGGHIPGALLFPWTKALTPDLLLRSESELRDLLRPVLDKPEAIAYCQSGVRAAHTAAVLRMLGHPRPRLYLGSWGEWGNRDDLPLETGEAEYRPENRPKNGRVEAEI